MLYNYGYFLNWKKVNQITSFGSEMVHCLTGISQYAIGQISLYPTNGLTAKSFPGKVCIAWPPRSPDLTSCDFYLRGFIKECVYVPPLPAELSDERHRMEADVARIS
ncbi:DUF4817 domain-containing protein [Trichonephila clavipes]|nr:DUF4817 domain-containing protein [Trichonephila clavipes]